ncbi:Lipid A export ATP-binding/permease protein MsbA [invertebrate metagenome]|uniref:Lipid A export ATP-binding/permease protein MsbA n=1 Tax=invertebrate metagenome TaxID=1711999 RepID=A0A484H612_9ZZZZ
MSKHNKPGKAAQAVVLDTSTWGLLRRLLAEAVQPYAERLGAAVLLMGVVAGTTAFTTYLLKPVVDEIFVARDSAMLWPVGGAVLLAFLVKGIADFGQTALMSFVGLRIVANMQRRLFNHLMQMDVPFFARTNTGNLIARFTNDVHLLRAVVSNTLVSFGKDLLTIIGLIVNMFIQDWLLAAVSFFIFPAAVLPIVRLGQRMRKVAVNTQEHMGTLATLLEQNFQGVRVVKSYGMEEYEQSRVITIIEMVFRLTLKAQFTRAFSSPLMETLGGVAATVVIIYGGWRVIANDMTAGAFFSFIASLLTAYRPLKALAGINATLQEGLASAQRLFALFDTRPIICESPVARPLAIAGGAIRFENVTFSYSADSSVTLDNLSLDVPAGCTVALVGPSGAGKTTILNLIPRFWDVQAGRITIDGADIRDVTLSSLRARIAVVSQEVTLFDDTVRANIAYGRPEASEAAIEAAARHAAAHAFISRLPDGYDTRVGERGMNLSGGQCQRLAIARAMLKDAPILLLDEATSALDTESERQIQDAIATLMHKRTTLVIAHRLSTVMNADVIYVIDKGRVLESGSHAELLTRGALYAHLYAVQFIEVA